MALGSIVGLLLLAGTVAGLWARHERRGSLARLEGEVVVPGLAALATVERDASGVPTIRGDSRSDVAIATGFVHAQERFFQMDLLRRAAAGELAALVGPAMVARDRQVRLHRFRANAKRDLEAVPASERRLLESYAAGVRAGLAAMGAAPPEYLLLRVEPEGWTPEDSILVVRAMYLRLQDADGERESALGVMRDVLPPELVAFLVPLISEHDAPLDRDAGEASPPPPPPEVFDLRTTDGRAPSLPTDVAADADEIPAAGSNAWAVSGRHTADGRAILANDMHLRLYLPNIWYRACLVWPDGDTGEEHRVSGVTLPGTPAVVVGSNGHVAWGVTNSEGDFSDLVVLEPDADGDRYRTPDGPRRVERTAASIAVRGGAAKPVETAWTIWGPLVEPDHRGRHRALRWVAHDPGTVDLGLLRMETARDVDEASSVAAAVGVPTVNAVVADSGGRVAWTLMGPVPRRVGLTGRWPESWADGRRGWDGYLEPDEYPRVVDPPAGRIWSANNRAVGADGMHALGDGRWALGARAAQIRDALLDIERADERDMLALQLDDRALFLARWRDLLLATLTPATLEPGTRRAELRRLVEDDRSGRAAVDSVGYRLVREFRDQTARRVLGPLTGRCRDADPRFSFTEIGRTEVPLWRLVTERPPHLLEPRHEDWHDLLVEAADAVIASFPEGLDGRTWGQRNTLVLRHPLSAGIPQLGRWLDFPLAELPGDSNMPRVQSPVFGASQRMVVAPGFEERGIFHMPGGQSGHPLSPHYRAGHEAWLRGSPTPLLPGPTTHRLTLRP